MIWWRFEFDEWTVGLGFTLSKPYRQATAHLGPLKITWVAKGTQFYRDLKATRK